MYRWLPSWQHVSGVSCFLLLFFWRGFKQLEDASLLFVGLAILNIEPDRMAETENHMTSMHYFRNNCLAAVSVEWRDEENSFHPGRHWLFRAKETQVWSTLVNYDLPKWKVHLKSSQRRQVHQHDFGVFSNT